MNYKKKIIATITLFSLFSGVTISAEPIISKNLSTGLAISGGTVAIGSGLGIAYFYAKYQSTKSDLAYLSLEPNQLSPAQEKLQEKLKNNLAYYKKALKLLTVYELIGLGATTIGGIGLYQNHVEAKHLAAQLVNTATEERNLALDNAQITNLVVQGLEKRVQGLTTEVNASATQHKKLQQELAVAQQKQAEAELRMNQAETKLHGLQDEAEMRIRLAESHFAQEKQNLQEETSLELKNAHKQAQAAQRQALAAVKRVSEANVELERLRANTRSAAGRGIEGSAGEATESVAPTCSICTGIYGEEGCERTTLRCCNKDICKKCKSTIQEPRTIPSYRQLNDGRVIQSEQPLNQDCPFCRGDMTSGKTAEVKELEHQIRVLQAKYEQLFATRDFLVLR